MINHVYFNEKLSGQKSFKVSKRLSGKIFFKLSIEKIPFSIVERKEDFFKVKIPTISGREFHKLVNRARLELLSEEVGIKIYSKKEIEFNLPKKQGETIFTDISSVKK